MVTQPTAVYPIILRPARWRTTNWPTSMTGRSFQDLCKRGCAPIKDLDVDVAAQSGPGVLG